MAKWKQLVAAAAQSDKLRRWLKFGIPEKMAVIAAKTPWEQAAFMAAYRSILVPARLWNPVWNKLDIVPLAELTEALGVFRRSYRAFLQQLRRHGSDQLMSFEAQLMQGFCRLPGLNYRVTVPDCNRTLFCPFCHARRVYSLCLKTAAIAFGNQPRCQDLVLLVLRLPSFGNWLEVQRMVLDLHADWAEELSASGQAFLRATRASIAAAVCQQLAAAPRVAGKPVQHVRVAMGLFLAKTAKAAELQALGPCLRNFSPQDLSVTLAAAWEWYPSWLFAEPADNFALLQPTLEAVSLQSKQVASPRSGLRVRTAGRDRSEKKRGSLLPQKTRLYRTWGLLWGPEIPTSRRAAVVRAASRIRLRRLRAT